MKDCLLVGVSAGYVVAAAEAGEAALGGTAWFCGQLLWERLDLFHQGKDSFHLVPGPIHLNGDGGTSVNAPAGGEDTGGHLGHRFQGLALSYDLSGNREQAARHAVGKIAAPARNLGEQLRQVPRNQLRDAGQDHRMDALCIQKRHTNPIPAAARTPNQQGSVAKGIQRIGACEKEITGAQCLKHLLQTIVHSTDLSFLVQEEVSSFTGRKRPFHTTPGDPTTDPKGRVEQESGQTGDRIGALEQDPPALQIGRQQPTLRRTACNEPLALRAAEGKLCN